MTTDRTKRVSNPAFEDFRDAFKDLPIHAVETLLGNVVVGMLDMHTARAIAQEIRIGKVKAEDLTTRATGGRHYTLLPQSYEHEAKEHEVTTREEETAVEGRDLLDQFLRAFGGGLKAGTRGHHVIVRTRIGTEGFPRGLEDIVDQLAIRAGLWPTKKEPGVDAMSYVPEGSSLGEAPVHVRRKVTDDDVEAIVKAVVVALEPKEREHVNITFQKAPDCAGFCTCGEPCALVNEHHSGHNCNVRMK